MISHGKIAVGLSSAALLLFAGCEGGTTGGPGAAKNTTNTTTPTGADRDTRSTDPGASHNTPSLANSTATNGANANSIIGQDANTFSLNVPNLATSLKQGETKQIAIAIRRGENFTQNVDLTFTGLPKGVTIEPSPATIKAGEPDAKLSVVAADNAPLGEATVTVVGHPGTGKDATNTFKIDINQK